MDKLGQSREIGILAVIIILFIGLAFFALWALNMQQEKQYVTFSSEQSLDQCATTSPFVNGSYFLDPVCKEMCKQVTDGMKKLQEDGNKYFCMNDPFLACADSSFKYTREDGAVCNFNISQLGN